jgi:hypothetical protein
MKTFLFLLLLFSLACTHRSFRVLPGDPDYLLRSPDSKQVPFREVLNGYNGFVQGKDWLDLRPRMELRVENAYYEEGAPNCPSWRFIARRVGPAHHPPQGIAGIGLHRPIHALHRFSGSLLGIARNGNRSQSSAPYRQLEQQSGEYRPAPATHNAPASLRRPYGAC